MIPTATRKKQVFLTAEEKKEICGSYASRSELAQRYNVSTSCIDRVRKLNSQEVDMKHIGPFNVKQFNKLLMLLEPLDVPDRMKILYNQLSLEDEKEE